VEGPWSDLIAKLFFGSLIVVAVAELLWPLRRPGHRFGPRWFANIALGTVNLLLARWLVPVSGALLASGAGLGLLNQLSPPPLLAIGIGVVVLDSVAYWTHRAMHAVPVLWRIHRVHHTDLDVDFTTGVRHHPIEVLITLAISVATIFVFGLPPQAVAVYQAGRAVIDITSHGNVRLPSMLDTVLRLVVVTPDMHRIHHSADRPETDSNYGTLLSVWDRLFCSYRRAPKLGQTGMVLGLREWRDETAMSISGLILMPFRSPAASVDPE